MSKLSRFVRRFQNRRVGYRSWSKYPPTKEDVQRSHNGYFWLKQPLVIDNQVLDTLIEVVQISYLAFSGDGESWGLDDMPLIVNGMHGKWTHEGRIEDPDLIRELLQAGYEWQMLRPPRIKRSARS